MCPCLVSRVQYLLISFINFKVVFFFKFSSALFIVSILSVYFSCLFVLDSGFHTDDFPHMILDWNTVLKHWLEVLRVWRQGLPTGGFCRTIIGWHLATSVNLFHGQVRFPSSMWFRGLLLAAVVLRTKMGAQNLTINLYDFELFSIFLMILHHCWSPMCLVCPYLKTFPKNKLPVLCQGKGRIVVWMHGWGRKSRVQSTFSRFEPWTSDFNRTW